MATKPDEEVHVAGIVVHTYPESVARVAESVEGIEGAQVHAANPDGKLVVTLEAHSSDAIANTLCRIQTLDSVLAAALVYQHSESAVAMSEEVDLEDHTQGIH